MDPSPKRPTGNGVGLSGRGRNASSTTVSALSAMEVLASALATASYSLGSMRRLLMIV